MTATPASPPPRTGARLLMDQLLIHGADRAFCVPGESYLALIDAAFSARNRFRLINARHEAGAAHMAAADAALTGRPGICMVTRGPGATHASVGVHAAMQDQVPLLLLVGQVPRASMGRLAFQEVDYAAMFAPLAKWAAQIDDPARIPELVSRAFRVAMSGRPGPVVLALPEDMLRESAAIPDAPPATPATPRADPALLARACAMLARAERPLIVAGGTGWSDAACAALARLAEGACLPVAASFRRQDLIDHHSPAYVGDLGTSADPALVRALAEADCIFALGAQLSDIATQGYATLPPPRIAARLIHLHVDPDMLGRVYAPDLAIPGAPGPAAEALAGMEVPGRDRRAGWARDLRAARMADALPPGQEAGTLDLGLCMAHLREVLPRDAIVVQDAGNHNGWVQRYLSFARPGRQLASTCGAMGYALPAALAASLRHPERTIVAMLGDGGFMMSLGELAATLAEGARPVLLVVDNAGYGTIRMHQSRDFPGRAHAVALANPPLEEVAAAMGAHAERVRETEAFAPALARARAAGRAAVLVLETAPEQLSVRSSA
ncbi:MAG: thiamine pyrophosphate-binding protein [Rhodobacteraceae bacterium]|nr:thiamine pyrophosphate-binding protein [Paracoccaceae bacterium]